MDLDKQITKLKQEQEADRARWEALPATGLQRGYVACDMEMRAGEIERLEKERARAELDALRDRIGEFKEDVLDHAHIFNPTAWRWLAEAERIDEAIDHAEQELVA